jgi:hypothetical protein
MLHNPVLLGFGFGKETLEHHLLVHLAFFLFASGVHMVLLTTVSLHQFLAGRAEWTRVCCAKPTFVELESMDEWTVVWWMSHFSGDALEFDPTLDLICSITFDSMFPY